MGTKITVEGDCSHKIKRCLLLGRKAITNLESTLKSRDIFLSTKVQCLNYGFSSSHVPMWELNHMQTIRLDSECFTFLVRKQLYLDFKFSFHHFPGALPHRWCEIILCTPFKSISFPFHWPIHDVHTKETYWWFIWCSTNQD